MLVQFLNPKTCFHTLYTHNNRTALCHCCLSKKKRLSSGEIAELLGLTNSNTSKVIRSVEDKGYVERNLGDSDKRQMYFSLTAEGKKILKEMECCNIEIPELLRSVL